MEQSLSTALRALRSQDWLIFILIYENLAKRMRRQFYLALVPALVVDMWLSVQWQIHLRLQIPLELLNRCIDWDKMPACSMYFQSEQ